MNWHGKRYYSFDSFLKNYFGEKIYKVSLDGGFTCPNRDGTLGTGGCIFCSEGGSGDFASSAALSVTDQITAGIEMVSRKIENGKYIAYFQNFTNTHGPVEVLRERFEQAVDRPDIVGINIGTRPDCLPDDVLDYLSELNERMTVWVELGLQTTYQETSDLINRAHDYQTYLDAVVKLRARGILVCVHLINGLPGETQEMMVENVRRVVADSDIQGIKLHLLHLMTGTRMQRDFHQGDLQLMAFEDYVNVICDQLEIIPKEISIHRLTGDAPREMLIGPMWSLKKWEVLNAIDAELERRNVFQGDKAC